MKKALVFLLTAALFLALALSALAENEVRKENLIYQGLKLVINGKPATPLDSRGDEVEPFFLNGTIYVPVGTIPAALGIDISWDKETRTIYIGEAPAQDATTAPSHCWVLVDTAHDVYEDDYDGARTWLYDYKDIPGGGRYVIDYTWDYNDEYSHYTAIGECTDPPAYILPDSRFTVEMKVYNENVIGDPGWGILSMGYIQYDRNAEAHYVFPQGFNNVEEDEPASYNAQDGDRTWRLWAEFPEGVPGETIEFTCQFHRGDRHPVKTTWTYAWYD